MNRDTHNDFDEYEKYCDDSTVIDMMLVFVLIIVMVVNIWRVL